jgi:hypothetical protein
MRRFCGTAALLGAALVASPPVSARPYAPEDDEPSAPVQLHLAAQGTPMPGTPFPITATLTAAQDLVLARLDLEIRLPAGVAHVGGPLRQTWSGPRKKGEKWTLQATVCVAPSVPAPKQAPQIDATLEGQDRLTQGTRRWTAAASLYLPVMKGALQPTDTLAITIKHTLVGRARLNEPLEILTEAVSPVDVAASFRIDLSEGLQPVHGKLKGTLRLPRGRPQTLRTGVKLTRPGRWLLGSYFEGHAGGVAVSGTGSLLLAADD